MSKRTIRAGTIVYLGDLPIRLESDAEASSDAFSSDTAFAEHLQIAGALELHLADLEKEVVRDDVRYMRSFGRDAAEVFVLIAEEVKPEESKAEVSSVEPPVKKKRARAKKR